MALSELEQKRQANIALRDSLLNGLALEAASIGLAPPKSRPKSKSASSKRSATPKVKEPVQPVRVSSRIRGIQADSDVAKRKAEEQAEAIKEQERKKKQRVDGDLNFDDIVSGGQSWDANGNFLRGVGPAQPNVRTFDSTKVKDTSDRELHELRERMKRLSYWEDVEPARIKMTQDRVYTMTFHPTPDKALIFAGDKTGSLGIFDGSQNVDKIKQEDDEDEMPEDPDTTEIKLHSRTVSAIQYSLTDSNSLFTASYDSSIRRFDLNKGVAVQVYAPNDPNADEPLSGIQLSSQDPHTAYFTTLNGVLGKHDMRTPSSKSSGTDFFQLSEKKIGGFSLHPLSPHFVVTASLDRTMKLWDLRKISGKGDDKVPNLIGEHESRLSVSHAAFNNAGQVVTTSYDDTLKIYDFSSLSRLKTGSTFSSTQMEPAAVVKHNNQTGRWVTIFKAHWQLHPQDGVQRFCVANMNRFIDIYDSKGNQLAQLGDDLLTAVPAAVAIHPTMDWIAGGSASGKLSLWM